MISIEEDAVDKIFSSLKHERFKVFMSCKLNFY